MGYTNYWTPNKNVTDSQKTKMVEFTKLAIEKTKVSIKNWDGNGSPEVTNDSIAFNGDCGDCGEFLGDSHESFNLLRDSEWNFCKTARKPYDELVKAVLIYAKQIGIVKEWSFDGDRRSSEYRKGLYLYQLVINEMNNVKVKTLKPKVNLSKINQSKVFYEYIYPVFAREFLIECLRYEDFAELVNKHFTLTERQWDSVLLEWELKEEILKVN